MALTMSVIVVLVRSDWAPAVDDWCFAMSERLAEAGHALAQDENREDHPPASGEPLSHEAVA